MKTPKALIDEAVRRAVAEVHPIRIILFGSAARGSMNRDSALDLLVIMPDGVDRQETVYRLHRSMQGLGCPKDIVVVFESEITTLGDNPSLVIHTALVEGKEVYRAA